MLIDYRIYGTLYAILLFCWMATPVLMEFYNFRIIHRWMGSVAVLSGIVGLTNFLDWLWS